MNEWNLQHSRYKERNTLSVIGQGIMHVKPDKVVITIGVKTENAEVNQALSENSRRAHQVIQALKAIGIKDEDIDTTSFSIYPTYDYSSGKSTIVGYEVEHIFEITVRDVGKVGSIYETAVSSGANIARNIQFQLSRRELYYQHALADALRNAREKAIVLTRTLGVPVNGIPLKIEEERVRQVEPIVSAGSMVLAEQSSPPIQTQDIIIKATVKAIFEY